MANPARSLSRVVSWFRVLPALGVNAATGLLPITTACPLCHGEKLRILDDKVLGGQWTHCGQCDFAGDLVELAGRAWGLEIGATVAQLTDLDLLDEQVAPEQIDGYQRCHVEYRRRLARFWQEARRQITKPTASPLWELMRRFAIQDQIFSPMWQEGMGHLVGSADCRQVQEVFHPGSYAAAPRTNPSGKATVRRGAGPGASRLFPGAGWADVLVVAFHDLPGRISGFLFIGRDADPAAGDVVFKPANYESSTVPFHEAGLGMWRAAEQQPHWILGRVLFAFSDPLLALRLQGQNARESGAPLPIVISGLDARARTEASLAHFSGRPLVFWGRDPIILRQAKAVDGLVSSYTLSDKEIAGGLRHREPAGWLQIILKHARPWRLVLGEQLLRCDVRAAEALLAHMEFSPEELRHFIASSHYELRERLDRCSPLRIAARRVVANGKTIVETQEGWVIERTGELVCNAAIRMEEVATTSAGEVFYRGIAHFLAADHAFNVSKADVDERGLLSCLFSSLLQSGAGVLQYGRNWDRAALSIAMQMGQPRAITGFDRIGWQPEREAFLFPRFAITRSGEVRDDLPPMRTEDPVPALALIEPRPHLFREELDDLSADTPEVAVFWAVAAGVIHNLLAAAMRYPACGVLLDGPGAALTGAAAARSLGCLAIDLRRRSPRETILEQINLACVRHDWPAALSLPESRALQVTPQWIESPGAHNAILSLNPYATLALATNGGFHLVHSEEPAAPWRFLAKRPSKSFPAISKTCAPGSSGTT